MFALYSIKRTTDKIQHTTHKIKHTTHKIQHTICLYAASNPTRREQKVFPKCDWVCRKCAKLNFSRRTTCFNCSAARTAEDQNVMDGSMHKLVQRMTQNNYHHRRAAGRLVQ